MNTLVLAIAGVLVLAGLVLIVVSFLVGRARPAADASEVESAPAGVAKEDGAFIDEPLTTDLATQLAGRRKPSSAPSASSADPSPESPVATDAESEATDIPLETDPGSQDDVAEAPAPTVAPVPEPTTRTESADQVGFDFQVRLGLEPLANAPGEDGVAQFNKALTHTDGGEAKLRLYVEIAADSSQQQKTDLGRAAHVQVTSYTDNPVLLKHLKRTLSEILEWTDVGATDGASGSEKESD